MRTYKKTIEPEKPKSSFHSKSSRKSQTQNNENDFQSFYRKTANVLQFTIALLTDGYNRLSLTKSADSFVKDVSTINRRYNAEGLSFFAKTLPSLFQSLLLYLETGESSYPGFRLKKGCEHPAFLWRLFAMIYNKETCEADRALYVDVVYQVCVAFKKLKGPYRSSVLRKQLADFVQTDIDLKYLDFLSDPKIRVILANARSFITGVIKDLDPEDPDQGFIPRPGPGATNTKREKNVRFRPHVLYTQLNDEFPYEEWFYSHPWDLVRRVDKHPFRLPVEDAPTSRFKFVPKTYGKPRGICIEQLETQYLQQALKKVMYQTIEHHPLTRGKVNFERQDINGELALVGSSDMTLATLDFSEASDRVSRRLVSHLFGGNELFCNKLMALSTRMIELPDEINFIKEFPTEKFAPMGSALCFPVMALVHYALIRAILRETGHKKHIPSLHVYGDDIIVSSQCVEEIFHYLPHFGMKLNKTKSFYKSKFRESCGLHAYNGIEITPVYFKYTPNPDMNVMELVSCLKTEAWLFKKGFFETSKLLRTELLHVGKAFELKARYLPHESALLGFYRDKADPILPRDFQRWKRRWNSELQCYEVKVGCLHPVLDKLPPIAPDEGLLRWFCTLAPLEMKGGVGSRTQTHVSGSFERLKIVHKWLPESCINPASMKLEMQM